MARFPHSYGELDLQKCGHELKYATFDFQDGRGPQNCVCIVGVAPTEDDYVRLWEDKDKSLHACINVSIDDASALNTYSKAEAAKVGKEYRDFHGQFHVDPRSAVYKKQLENGIATIVNLSKTDIAKYNALREKYKLGDQALADWRARSPQSCPSTVEQIAENIVRASMRRRSAAGRVYAPSLNDAVAPAVSGVAVATTIPAPAVAPAAPPAMTAPAQPQYAAPCASVAPAPAPAAADDDLPF